MCVLRLPRVSLQFEGKRAGQSESTMIIYHQRECQPIVGGRGCGDNKRETEKNSSHWFKGKEARVYNDINGKWVKEKSANVIIKCS